MKPLHGIIAISLLITGNAHADGWDPTSAASNVGGIVNTRHNLTQSFLRNTNDGLGIAFMNMYRNNYGEVCVYCHTPHGANTQMGAAPLWNRTKPAGPFKLYDKQTTLDRPITQPGPNSLTCLSCHDGTTAIDSIINMPGSGGYSGAQETSVNNAFLDSWIRPSAVHGPMGDSIDGCVRCHNNASVVAASFDAFVLGNDLSNDHPVGVKYPETFGAGVDFAEPDRRNSTNTLAFFDRNASGRADTNEIRLYNSGGGFEVECASCHDPHGVPEAGPGSKFIPSFLRVKNTGSAVCLACHIK